jgi:hypothetical protein
MTYRIVFRERSDETGERADNPPSFLDSELEDGVVLDARFIARLESAAQHNSDRLEEDDGFLARSTAEIWEYDIADEQWKVFEDAIRNSGMVMEFERLDSANEMRAGA